MSPKRGVLTLNSITINGCNCQSFSVNYLMYMADEVSTPGADYTFRWTANENTSKNCFGIPQCVPLVYLKIGWRNPGNNQTYYAYTRSLQFYGLIPDSGDGFQKLTGDATFPFQTLLTQTAGGSDFLAANQSKNYWVRGEVVGMEVKSDPSCASESIKQQKEYANAEQAKRMALEKLRQEIDHLLAKLPHEYQKVNYKNEFNGYLQGKDGIKLEKLRDELNRIITQAENLAQDVKLTNERFNQLIDKLKDPQRQAYYRTSYTAYKRTPDVNLGSLQLMVNQLEEELGSQQKTEERVTQEKRWAHEKEDARRIAERKQEEAEKQARDAKYQRQANDIEGIKQTMQRLDETSGQRTMNDEKLGTAHERLTNTQIDLRQRFADRPRSTGTTAAADWNIPIENAAQPHEDNSIPVLRNQQPTLLAVAPSANEANPVLAFQYYTWAEKLATRRLKPYAEGIQASSEALVYLTYAETALKAPVPQTVFLRTALTAVDFRNLFSFQEVGLNRDDPSGSAQELNRLITQMRQGTERIRIPLEKYLNLADPSDRHYRDALKLKEQISQQEQDLTKTTQQLAGLSNGGYHIDYLKSRLELKEMRLDNSRGLGTRFVLGGALIAGVGIAVSQADIDETTTALSDIGGMIGISLFTYGVIKGIQVAVLKGKTRRLKNSIQLEQQKVPSVQIKPIITLNIQSNKAGFAVTF